MKTIFTILMSLLISVVIAQDKVFVHKATTGNSTGNVTTLDHPDLNGNPNANIIISHNLNSEGVQYNNKITGTWYDGSNWTVFNEDLSSIIEGSSYNIYIPQGGKLITEEADGSSYTLELNDPAINGNPNAIIVYANYWNPNQVYNNHNYGFWYSDSSQRWNIYNEETTTEIPANATFSLLIDEGTGNADAFSHITTAGNTTANYTILDHPSLNGKPEAYPVISHNWGTASDSWSNILDKTIGVWYNGNNWTIYTEDTSTMPEDIKFNIYVASEPLSINDQTIANITTYPNPTRDQVTFTSKSAITSVSIYNLLGQKVKEFVGNKPTNLTINISELAAGNYIAKVQAGKAVQSVKLIKL